ncbi:molybdopterin-dependent oxidoreductase [Sphingomonas sp.]|uniref:molybdopterin-dependent oxidoreductase n=1 Tax=Sphingomonas sp. TaxID=28214 RepID=UPI003B3B2187
MDAFDFHLARSQSRRQVLAGLGLGGAAVLSTPAIGQSLVELGLPGGPSTRPMTSEFPQKGAMILQRLRPPLLETPMEVFDGSVFTPNDRFFVRWHWANIPTAIDVASYRIAIRGHVDRQLSISLAQLLRMPRIELAAVNQCSGNSRGLFEPRVPGAQWRHGAMGNARWVGVSLRHLLDLAGVRSGALAVRFGALDQPVVPTGPDFSKSLAIDHARNGEVIVAFQMNGEQMPLLNGFPARLIVPGWYSTYWVKMLNDIEVLDGPDQGYWMAKAYKIPDTPGANVAPGTKDFPSVPINRMVPRSWITSWSDGTPLGYAPDLPVGGIAMGGDAAVARVDISADHGRTWHSAKLGPDEGKYGFRRFDANVRVPRPGKVTLMSRCTSAAGETQPISPNWNPGGFMRGCVETSTVTLV